MIDLLGASATLFQPIAMALALAYVFGLLAHTRLPQMANHVVMGVLFGFVVAVSMLDPIPMGQGYIVDLRNLMIFVATVFVGPVAGLITLIAGMVMRYELGGAGMQVGMVSMVISYAAGLVCLFALAPPKTFQLKRLSMLGLACSSHLVVTFMLPPGIREDFLFNIVPVVLLGNFIGVISIGSLFIREIALLEKGQRLLVEATQDPLTRLLNRRSLMESVAASEVDREPNKGRAILYIDIDNFKQLNDSEGHLIGDAVLQTVTDRIKGNLRPNDLFSRIGGDEFVVVLPNVTEDVARTVAKRCHASISDTQFNLDEKSYHVTISLGAHWSSGHPRFEDHLAHADKSLYAAKDAGRDCVAFTSDNDTDPTVVAAA